VANACIWRQPGYYICKRKYFCGSNFIVSPNPSDNVTIAVKQLKAPPQQAAVVLLGSNKAKPAL
jgi:hypothetical protein